MGAKQHRSHLDEYERRFMGARGVVFRDRVFMAPWGHLLFAIVALAPLVRERPSLLAACVALPCWALLLSVGVVVTDEHVRVHLGPFGPRISLDAIVSAEPEAHTPMSFGIRFGAERTVTYSVPSFGARFLLIEYRKGAALRRVRVMCSDPRRVCQAIERVRAQRGMFREMVRIGGLPGDVDLRDSQPLEAQAFEPVDVDLREMDQGSVASRANTA